MSERPNQVSRLVPKNVFVSIRPDEQTELIDFKLPSSLRIQPLCFEPENYSIEEPVKYINEKGVQEEKHCAIENILRWRYAQDEETGVDLQDPHLDSAMALRIKSKKQPKIESNAKIVQWSDGSQSLAIGDEFYETQTEQQSKTQIFSQFENISLLKDKVSKKMIVKPSLKSQRMQKRIVKRINEQNKNVSAANITVAMDDPKYQNLGAKAGQKQKLNLSYEVEQADPEESLSQQKQSKKRTFQEAKNVLESDEEDKQQVKKRQKTGLTDEQKVMGRPEVYASGSEEEYVSKEQMLKRAAEAQEGSGSSSSSSSNSSESAGEDNIV